jgi:Ca2+-binding EF-hand superfamily protein
VAKDLGMTLSDKEIQELIMRADEDGDGVVKEEEFYHILTYRK